MSAVFLPLPLGEGWGEGGLRVQEPSAKYLAQAEPALLRGFELLATAPGAVVKLRELILLLAVQGKLVPQDAKEGSGVALLSQLQAEPARMKTTGERKRSTPLVAIDKSEQAFSLPENWAWARLGWITKAVVDCPHSTPKFIGRGVLCLDTNSFKNGSLIPHKLRYVAEATFAERVARLVPEPGDLVFAREGSVGESVLIPEGTRCCLGQRVMLFRFSEEVSNRFVQQAITSRHFLAALLEMHKGIGAKHVNVGDMRNAVIPIPPLAEQHRIVARVEELMRLCDALEQSGRLADEQHARLTSTLFDALAASESAHALAENWQRIAEHFDLLLDRPEAIDALEQTILQLAVRGLLVPQDATDEPAAALLIRVRAERERLISVGQIKKDKLAPALQHDELLVSLPQSWEWARFGALVDSSEAGWSPNCEGSPRSGASWGVLKVSAVSWGQFRSYENKELPKHLEARSEFEVRDGDFLISRANTAELVARSVVVSKPEPRLMLSDKIIRLRISSLVDRQFFNLVNNSRMAREHYAANCVFQWDGRPHPKRHHLCQSGVAYQPLELNRSVHHEGYNSRH